MGKQPIFKIEMGAADPVHVRRALEELGCTTRGWDEGDPAETEDARTARLSSAGRGEPQDFRQQVFRECPDAILTASAEGVITACNASAVKLFGWHEDEISGRPLEELLPLWKGLAAEQPGFGRDLPAGAAHRLQGRRRDGSMFPSSVSVARGAGTTASWILVIRDASEYEQLERQFIQAQKMESVGLLAASVAHDFNNALTALRAQLYVTLAASGEGRRLLECQAILDRCAGQTKGLLAFASSHPRGVRLAELSSAATEAIRMACPLLPTNVTIVTEYLSRAAWVSLEPNQTSHVVLNLVLNAGDALRTGGTITVKISSTPGGVCRLVVEDDGEGMSGATLARAFEPFFTTKAPGRGTGLGLFAVRWTVEQAGGTVSIVSRVGEGTRVVIELPSVAGSTCSSAAEGEPCCTRGAGLI